MKRTVLYLVGIMFLYGTFNVFSVFALTPEDITITILQTFLVDKGYLVMPQGVSKGVFGPLTKNALIEYQKSVGLNSQGIFGPLTKAKIIEYLSPAVASSTNTGANTTITQNIALSAPVTSLSQAIGRDEFNSRLQAMQNDLTSKIFSISSNNSNSISNLNHVVAQSQRIDSLTNTAISNPTITGGSITGTSITGATISSPSFSGNVGIKIPATSVSLTVDGGVQVAERSDFQGFPTTGAGLELASLTGRGIIQDYNRNTNTWGNLDINAQYVNFSNGSTPFNSMVGIGVGGTPAAYLDVRSRNSSFPALAVGANVSGDQLIVLGNGKVGIGTTTIGAKLTVDGGIQVADRPDANGFATSGSGLELVSFNGSGFLQDYNRNTSTWGNLKINGQNVNFAIGGTPVSSRVGIGVPGIPSALLDMFNRDSGNMPSLSVGATVAGDQLIVLGNGKVGIGTTSPLGLLSVNPNGIGSGVPEFVVGSSTATHFIVDGGGNVGIGTTNVSAGRSFEIVRTGGSAVIGLTGTAGKIINTTGDLFIQTGVGSNTIFQNNNAEVMRLDSSNRVGIGTTSPYQKLSVAGNVLADSFIATSTTATSTISTGGLAVGTSQFVVQQNSGYVGIGVANPVTNLHVEKSVDGKAAILLFNPSDTANAYAEISARAGTIISYLGAQPVNAASFGAGRSYVDTNSTSGGFDIITEAASGDIRFYTAGYAANKERMRINSAGNVGIGTTSPWRTLSVTGNVGFDGLTAGAGAGTLCLSANKEVTYSAGATCTVSSERFKHNINTSIIGLDFVNQLRPVTFEYNKDIGVSGEQFGLIAEEVEKLDPRLVVHDAGGLPYSVRYENLTAILVKAIQELSGKISPLLSWFSFNNNNLCVDNVCVTREQFKQILIQAGGTNLSQPQIVASSPASSPALKPIFLDTEAPVITLIGDGTINLSAGDSYIEQGATTTDNVDSSVPVSIGGSVDTSIAGSYTITYNATDTAGNGATEITRTVNINGPPGPVPGLPNTGVLDAVKSNQLNIVIVLFGVLVLIGVLILVID